MYNLDPSPWQSLNGVYSTCIIIDNLCISAQVILKFLPLMIGWFSLNLPSGLGLYYFANTFLTTAQQIWLRKLGGVVWPGHKRSHVPNLVNKRMHLLSGAGLSTDQCAHHLPMLAGASSKEFDLGPIGVGQGRRTGAAAAPLPPLDLPCLASSSSATLPSADTAPAPQRPEQHAAGLRSPVLCLPALRSAC